MTENETARSIHERKEFEQALVGQMGALTAFTRSLTWNRHAADDLTQEALARALQHWERFKPGTNMKAWLFVIARNEFYSSHRRNKTVIGHANMQRALCSEVGESPQIPQAEAAYDLKQLLERMADQSREQMEVILAIALEGKTYDEIAADHECPVGTVKSRASRGRARLHSLQ